MGVRVTAGRGNHYVLYSFAPGLRVLNGFLQAITGLYDYAKLNDDRRARRLFRAGDRRARRETPRYDTGSWSYYALPNKNLSTLDYHVLVTGFLENLCGPDQRARLLPDREPLRPLYAQTRRHADAAPRRPAAPGQAMRVPLVAGAIAAAVVAAPAQASPVLEVRPDGTVLRDDPYLPPRSETDLPRPAGPAAAPPARAAAGTTVRRALTDAYEAGRISAEERREWRSTYNRALRTRANLAGARRIQLSSVIETLEAIARAGQLDASRMPALFLLLQRNTEYWPNRPYPANGQRISFAGSRMIFQYYAGRGLQIQPLANFGKANGLWRAGREEQLRELLDELVAIASRRGRFTTWEYWFRFGGGTPPWMSAMAQGTAIQALSRASVLLADPSYLRVARRGIRAFSTRAPLGVRTAGRDGGNHYLIYSFSRGLRVLNAFAQSLNGLYDYATIADHARAMRLFEKGEVSLRAELPDYDTGAWTLYSLGGAEAPLEYHELATDFLANLCEKLGPGPYCDAAARFDGYQRESPRLELKTSRLVEDNLQYVRFALSKRSTVQITVSRGGDIVYSASAIAAYGTRAFAWTPTVPGDYSVTLSGESFNGTEGSTTGTITVRARS